MTSNTFTKPISSINEARGGWRITLEHDGFAYQADINPKEIKAALSTADCLADHARRACYWLIARKSGTPIGTNHTPQEDAYALLRAYMARVIDVEGVSFVNEGTDYGNTPRLNPEQKAQLLAIEQEVRQYAG